MVEVFTKDHDIGLTKGGHLSIELRHRGNKRTVFAPQTPSDHRSMLDVKRKIKHAYFELATAA
nr:hypothetical protein [Neorhizobium tomejilense]